MAEETVRRRLVVRGRVQGVFFRETCRRVAQKAGVAGWVRNRADGSVEVVAEGPAEAVDTLTMWCRSGPSSALVTGVDVADQHPEGLRRFEVR